MRIARVVTQKKHLFLMQNEFVRIRLVKATIFAIKKAEPWPKINPTKAPYILYTAKSSSWQESLLSVPVCEWVWLSYHRTYMFP